MPLVDYVVLTPLDEEWISVRDVLHTDTAVHEAPIGATTYYLWLRSVDHLKRMSGDYLMVGASMGHRTKGQAYAGVFSSQTLLHWKPSRVTLLGIAGSLEPDKVKLGDVVVADQIFGYLVGDANDSGTTFRSTYNQLGALDLDRIRAFHNSRVDYQTWQQECMEGMEEAGLKRVDRAPQLHIAPVASGDYVVKSESFGNPLCANIGETPEYSIISEQGGKEDNLCW